jgi:hypothetical protein
VDDRLLTTVLANASRPDVAAAIGDNGLHGFNVTTPNVLKTGAPRSIGIRFESTTADLGSSPRTITCAPAAFAIGGPKITSFKIQSDSNKTTTNPDLTLEVEFDGAPSFYRIGEIDDLYHPEEELSRRPWQPYTSGIAFTFHLNTSEPYGTRFVSMQINSGTSESGASPPKGDGVILAPLSTKTFTLTGQALTSFVNRAAAIGYRFRLSGPSYDGAYPCSDDTVVDPASVLKVVTGYSPGEGFTETRVGRLFERGDPFLNPFWRMTALAVADLYRPADPSLVTIHGPFTGRVDDPGRRVGFKRSFTYPKGIDFHDPGTGAPFAAPFGCVPVGEPVGGPSNSGFLMSLVTSITLVGPADKTPEDAMFPPPKLLLFPLPGSWPRRLMPLPPPIPRPEP